MKGGLRPTEEKQEKREHGKERWRSERDAREAQRDNLTVHSLPRDMQNNSAQGDNRVHSNPTDEVQQSTRDAKHA